LFTALLLVLTTFVLGPAGGVSFAFTQHIPPLETALAVSAVHLALVPVWFGIFELLRYSLRYENHFVTKLMKYGEARSGKLRAAAKDKIQEFERRVGQRGFGLGVVGFTFLFGVSWAALAAFLLDIKKKTIMVSVAVGAVASSLFWTFVFAWLADYAPSPWIIYAVCTVLTLAVISHKKIRERKLIRAMSRSLRKLGVKMK
jgi:uncharacterized membrane protein